MKFIIALLHSLDIALSFCLVSMVLCLMLMFTILSVASIYAWAPSLEPHLNMILLAEKVVGGVCIVLVVTHITKKKVTVIKREWSELERA